jgi:maltooligosyltrehalose trehalohydrolase
MSDSSDQISPRLLGAEVSSNGVRYTVWAPEKSHVSVHIRRTGPTREADLPLERTQNGYFTEFDAEGCAGDLYTFSIDDQEGLPDLASRYQPQGLSGPSMVIDPAAYRWKAPYWKRPTWRQQVVYELHIGAFTPEGTFHAASGRLDHLVNLGVTAVELMPLAQCTGTRNWGYDGVLLFAPYHSYGTPDDLRAFVDACHGRGLAFILDVVYNHIGAVGDSTHTYSKFFAHQEDTGAWGRGYNLDGENSGPVRQFLLQNITYWLDEFRVDGFRFDATHAIRDGSPKHFVAEATELIHAGGGFAIAEDERNTSEIFKPLRDGGWRIDAAWADDFHHAMRVAQTHENQGYLGNFTGSLDEIADTLRHGWHFRGQTLPKLNQPRGTESQHLPSASFVYCISNHDQVGNRPFGDRLHHLIAPAAYRAVSLFFCLTPYTPLIFMGQEWGATSPFLFFSDHPGDFGRLVSEGRKREFEFASNELGKPLPDCQSNATFLESKLRWDERLKPPHRETLLLYREALRLRHDMFAGENPARECWSVHAGPQSLSLLYRLPAGELEVIYGTSRPALETAASKGQVLLRSNEKRFGGVPDEPGPGTMVLLRPSSS